MTLSWAQTARRNAPPRTAPCCFAPLVMLEVLMLEVLDHPVNGRFWAMRIVATSAIGFVLGATAAYAVSRYPGQREIIETVAGIILIGGLGLLGFALEIVLRHP